jgi:predicted ABC-type ATPase
MAEKVLYIVGGPNGAGKTTFIRNFLKANPVEYLSADAIAADLSPQNPALALIEAAREFVRRLSEVLASDQSCLIESTLSGRSLHRAIQEARLRGFRVEMKFLFISSAELSLARVRQRVRKGGHNVPDADVLRRFSRTFRNFWRLYRPLADLWVVAYNDASGPQDAVIGTPVGSLILDEALFQKFIRIAESDDADAGNQ